MKSKAITLLAISAILWAFILGISGIFLTALDMSSKVVKTQPAASEQVLDTTIDDLEIELMNNSRLEAGKTVLKKHEALVKSAYAKCLHMVEYDYWAHSGGGAEWLSFVDAVTGYKDAGENLARGWADEYKQHIAWVDSPGHYENMIGSYEYVGVATCQYPETSKHAGVLTVVHFANL